MAAVTYAGRLRQELSLHLADHPRLFYPVMRQRTAYRGVLISRQTELVIEGYPRSGNTFAVAAVQFAQGRPMAIARHTHAPAQVMEATRRRLPTIVLLRDPRDAGLSLVIRERHVSPALALRRYLRFYGRLAPFSNRFIVATFAQVTTDLGAVIERVNSRWGLQLTPFHHTPANRAAVFEIMEDMERRTTGGILSETRVARPSAARDSLKHEFAHAFDRPAYRSLLDACYRLHEKFEARSLE
jgi:hypothetical protein